MTYTNARDMYRDHMAECLMRRGYSREQAYRMALDTYPQRSK